MFSFLGSLVSKIASAVASVFVTVGLLSAPASVAPQPTSPETPVVVETATSTQVTEEKEKTDVKAELEKLKKQLVEEQTRRKALEKKVVIPRPEGEARPSGAAKQTPAPTPVVTPIPVVVTPPPPPPAPKVELLPGQFMLPSGAIVDSTGKVVKEAPIAAKPAPVAVATTTPAPSAPPPAPVWPPADGSTVDIQRSILSVINFNPQLTCDQLLALPPSKKDLCKLYKENQGNNKYTWRIIEDL